MKYYDARAIGVRVHFAAAQENAWRPGTCRQPGAGASEARQAHPKSMKNGLGGS